MKKNKTQIVFTIFLLMISIGFVYLSFDFPVRSRVIPLMVGILTMFLSIIQLLFLSVPALQKRNIQKVELFSKKVDNLKKKSEEMNKDNFDKKEVTSNEMKKFASICMWISSLFIGIYLIGYLIALPVFVFLYYLIKDEQSILKSLIITAIVWVVIYGTFEMFLEINLFRGIIMNLF